MAAVLFLEEGVECIGGFAAWLEIGLGLGELDLFFLHTSLNSCYMKVSKECDENMEVQNKNQHLHKQDLVYQGNASRNSCIPIVHRCV